MKFSKYEDLLVANGRACAGVQSGDVYLRHCLARVRAARRWLGPVRLDDSIHSDHVSLHASRFPSHGETVGTDAVQVHRKSFRRFSLVELTVQRLDLRVCFTYSLKSLMLCYCCTVALVSASRRK